MNRTPFLFTSLLFVVCFWAVVNLLYSREIIGAQKTLTIFCALFCNVGERFG